MAVFFMNIELSVLSANIIKVNQTMIVIEVLSLEFLGFSICPGNGELFVDFSRPLFSGLF